MSPWDDGSESDGRTTRRIAVALTLAAITLLVVSLAFGSRPANSHLAVASTPKAAPIVHRADHGRWKTWACQDQLGKARTVTVYSDRSSPSRPYRRWVARLWEKRATLYCKAAADLSDPVRAIYSVFGSAADEAVRVFRCESGLSIYANNNGTYLGIAQMGPYARSRYGHSNTLLGQLRAAYAYYRDAGWRPWECARSRSGRLMRSSRRSRQRPSDAGGFER